MAPPPSNLIGLIAETIAALPNSLDAIQPPPTLPTSPASLIDHTLLAPPSTSAAIQDLARDAIQLGTATICVPSSLLPIAVEALASQDDVKACCVVGFPFGNGNTAGKVQETIEAVAAGAKEVDMVQNVGWVKEQKWDEVWRDVAGVVEAAKQGGATVKVILETAYLTREEVAASTLISCLAGADFVKTSTGYAPAGATPEVVRLMHHVASPHGVKVKASGGIRSWATMQTMIENGASRIGASGTAKILEEWQQWKAGAQAQTVASDSSAAGGY